MSSYISMPSPRMRLHAWAQLPTLLLLISSALAREPVCLPRPDIQQKLATLAKGWHGRLSHEEGYAPPTAFTVCQLHSGLPYADHQLQRIYIRNLAGVNDEITLAHEYLHLAFSHHPRGRNETFIETMALSLVESP
ncbi:DUF2300 domain-containing protein [Iodobacter sp. CM08]|uniref:DUF2300 domain-containing protein n=1 Tax=Iodobacter sp. CM08 TaxID=3085902 RepID=UPI00298105AF|nr:DUF2300 domain-containing protein [Iodobacter sp. CM08]MDW5415719.1 DUF2300 domain-containing protein [Iodobacter sp. CM08]